MPTFGRHRAALLGQRRRHRVCGLRGLYLNRITIKCTGRKWFFRPVVFLSKFLKYYPRSGYVNSELRIPNSELNRGSELNHASRFKISNYPLSLLPSLNAVPTFSPITQYALFTGSKVMGRSFAGSIFPSVSTLSSALTLTISPIIIMLSRS